LKEIIDLIDKYWKFDEDQQPLSTWHDKQELLELVSNWLEKLGYSEGVPQPMQTAGQTCHNCLFNGREHFGEQSEVETQTCYNSKSLMSGKSVDGAYKTKFYCSEWKLKQ